MCNFYINVNSEWKECKINICSGCHYSLMLKSLYSDEKLRKRSKNVIVSHAHWKLFDGFYRYVRLTGVVARYT